MFRNPTSLKCLSQKTMKRYQTRTVNVMPKFTKTMPNRPSKNSFSGIQFSEGNLLMRARLEDRGRNHSRMDGEKVEPARRLFTPKSSSGVHKTTLRFLERSPCAEWSERAANRIVTFRSSTFQNANRIYGP